MFEILMFLFENYMNGNAKLLADNQTIVTEMERIGFDRYDVSRAIDWLEGLYQFQVSVDAGPRVTALAMRHYLPEEFERLSVDGIGLLVRLEHLNILDATTREVVIDRLMALDPREVDLGRIKWVVLLALFNQPDKKSAIVMLQDMILADAFKVMH